MTNNLHQGFPIPQKDYYKVYVRSITYNQAPYIEDCLNGVAMQQTDFPFVHHVIDDCSTDGEQEVIKAYLNNNCDMENAEYYDNDISSITIAKNKSNPNCTLVAYFLKRNIYKDRKKREELYSLWRDVCLYEALCEGDDYWIDNQKLQNQVVFLNSNIDYGIIHSNFFIERNNTKTKGNWGKATNGESFLDYLKEKYFINTPTVMFRLALYKKIDHSYLKENFKMGDAPLWLELMHLSKIKKLDDYTSAYRILQNSASHSKDPANEFMFMKEGWIVRLYYAKKYAPQFIKHTTFI